MTETPKPMSWMSAIAEAAEARAIRLPPFSRNGMGTARSEPTASGRFVTLKRRLVRTDEAHTAMEWTLWESRGDLPEAVASFRQPERPQPSGVVYVLSVLKGWLVDELPAATVQSAVTAVAQPDEATTPIVPTGMTK